MHDEAAAAMANAASPPAAAPAGLPTDASFDPFFIPAPRTGVPSAWYGHVPLAYWIMQALRPRLFVELGTHNGVSYAAFCDAVARLKLDTRCFAVDTWQGDEHAGHYGEDVFRELQLIHDANYAAYSEMVRSTFDQAREYFADGSIDLLHIDGCHSYEAVRHDYDNWRPKLSPRAVVLFHDTNVRERHFGVWRLWAELSREHGGFEFMHEHGLGVLAAGTDVPGPVRDLCSLSDPALINRIRDRFAASGRRCIAESEVIRLRRGEAALAQAVHAQQADAEHRVREAEQRRVAGEQALHAAHTAEFAAHRAALDAATAARDEAEAARAAAQAAEAGARAELAAVRVAQDQAAAEAQAEITRLRAAANEAAIRTYRLDLAKRAEHQHLLAQIERDRHGLEAAADTAAAAAKAATDTAYEARDAAHRTAGDLRAQLDAALAASRVAMEERDVIRSSTLWRAANPLRRIGRYVPRRIKRHAVRTARVAWWMASLQLRHRLQLQRAVLAARALPPPVTPMDVVALPPPAPLPPAPLPPPPAPVAAPPARTPAVLQDVDRPVAVIIDHLWPQPDRDAGSVDAVNLTDSLILLGYHVVFAAVHDRPELLPYRDDLTLRGAHCLGPNDATSLHSLIADHGEAVSLFVLVRYTAGGQFLELIRHAAPQAKIVFSTVDLHFLREEREARLAGDDAALQAAERSRDREQFLALKSDATLVVSPAEHALLSAAVPGARIVELPLARPDRRTAPPPFDTRRDIGFIGGYAHGPNIDAVRFFLAEIWPLVRVALPGCRFVIAGTGLPDDVLAEADDRVRYDGHVADLDAWFDRLRLTVAPLRWGAGLKGKVISSMAAGVPCVGSSIAMEGIPLAGEEDAALADTPGQIAERIVRLYQDPALWTQLSASGQARARQLYSLDMFRTRLHELLITIGLPCLTPPAGG